MSETPETGDPVVDEVIATYRATSDRPLTERASAAAEAQRKLQERLAESSPGNSPASAMQRVAGSQPSR
jgi:hypothetical protein